MLALFLVAVSLGLSNFAASVGIGVAGVDASTRLRVALVFGLFETAMPVAGLLIGRSLAGALGGAAHWAAGILLAGAGAYALIQAARDPPGHASSPPPPPGERPGRAAPRPPGAGGETPGQGGMAGRKPAMVASGRRNLRLVVAGIALSADNLTVGFALGTYHVNVALAAVVIGAVSVALSLLGLELGNRLGAVTGKYGGFLGGAILVATGIAILIGTL